MNAGIDYGLGHANIDRKTGIRYGVISQHSVLQAWADSSEADYGSPYCPCCGNDAAEYDSEKDDDFESSHGCADYMCESCKLVFDSSEAFSDEPLGFHYSGDGYEASSCLDSDIIITLSPFFTLANYCSPCVPGAGNLNSANDDGIRAYCFGHDWFENGRAPYPVYSVETGQLVEPQQ